MHSNHNFVLKTSEKNFRIFLRTSALSLKISIEFFKDSALGSRDILPSSRINFQYVANIYKKRYRFY